MSEVGYLLGNIQCVLLILAVQIWYALKWTSGRYHFVLERAHRQYGKTLFTGINGFFKVSTDIPFKAM